MHAARRIGIGHEYAAAIGTWLLLLGVMTANGAFRELVLRPRLGDSAAEVLSALLGVVWVLGGSGLLVARHRDWEPVMLWRIGALWTVLTLAFELLFGHYGMGQPWRSLLADYNLADGRLWPLVLLSVLMGPPFWGWWRSRARSGGSLR